MAVVLIAAMGGVGEAQVVLPLPGTPGDTTTQPATSGPTNPPAVPPTGPNDVVVVHDIRGVMRRRVVKSFDFDERKRGNVEPVPMYWQRHLGKGFPHFLSGRFDLELGHDAPPSFYLGLKGGSLGYVYRGQDVPVHMHSDYLISVWVRPDKLNHARAYATAFYYDRNGRKVPGTERFSRRVGGAKDSQDWQPLTIELPGGYTKARQIGVGLWVTQPPAPSGSDPDGHSIYRQDIHTGAWFDEVQVVRLPRASLTTGQEGNVFTADQQPALHAEVSDLDGKDLSVRLEVVSADGRRLLDQQLEMTTHAHLGAREVKLGRLAPGLYRGRLTIWSGKLRLSEREIRFAQLGPRLNAGSGRNEGFGLVLDQDDYACPGAAARLIDLLHVTNVKLPLGGPQLSKQPDPVLALARQKLLEWLWQERIDAVAMLASGVPAERSDQVDRASESWRSLLLALAEKPEAWRPYLARPLVSSAGFVQSWQTGPDDDDALAWDARVVSSLDVFRRELNRLLPSAEVAVPWPILHQAPVKPLEAQYVSLYVPNTIRPEGIASHVRDFKKVRPQGLWTVVQPLASGRYDRLSQLADLTKRLACAHAAGVEVVYLPKPWETTRRTAEPQIEPHEAYLIFRTVAELLSRSRPAGQFYLSEGVHSLIFDRDGAGILVVWDDQAPPKGRSHTLYLGSEPEQVDMWGRVQAVPRVGKRHRIRLGRVPTFVRGTEVWHLKLRNSFALDPAKVESSYRLHEQTVRFVNPLATPISGVMRLSPPPGWEVRPVRTRFSLAPGQELRTRVTLRFPSNEVAGRKSLAGLFIIDSDRSYELTALTPFELGLDDIEAHSFARIERNSVIVNQTITNRSQERVDIEGYVLAPGRARLVRMYRRVDPGQTIVKKYILDNASRLRGRAIRVGLKEIRGPRLLNQIVWVQ